MQIDPGVHLVGSGKHGIDLTESHDCNVYVFNAGESYVMFDTGAGVDPEKILQVCLHDGLNRKKPYHLFLTHGHADHSGGGSYLQDQLDLKIYASPSTAERVADGDEIISLPEAIKAGVYPPDYVYRTYEVNEPIEDGENLMFGNLEVGVIFTPGHSDDHASYIVTLGEKRYLISGDAVFYDGRVILQNSYDCNVPLTITSIQRLAELSFEALLPGHLLFSLGDGKRHIDTACDIIRQLGCPPSI